MIASLHIIIARSHTGGYILAETQLQKLERQFEQAKNRLQAAKTRATTKQRKLDTRRKVILGGALIDLAERDDTAVAMVERLIRNLSRSQDQKAFDGWDVQTHDIGLGDSPDE